MLQSTRERLALLLIGLLPFHALLVTFGTQVLEGPGNSPLTVLALWKEALLGLILLLAVLEWLKKPSIKLDIFDWLILGMLALSVIVTAQTHGDWKLYAYGFKYDFVPLVAFLVLRRVAWSEGFLDRAFKTILISAGVVCIYGMISWYLPQSFFSLLGYSDLHSLYTPDGPLAAFQQIGGTSIRRLQSTMSGPNQLGLWLLLPFSIIISRNKKIGSWGLVVGVFVLCAMFMTLSRSALLAAAVMVGLTLWKQLSQSQFWKFAGALFVASFVLAIGSYFTIPDIVVRTASTSDHISRPMEAVRIIRQHPFGLGLGMAGPASNRVSDTCVHLEEGADASWAADRPNLCVFVGDVQAQPEDRECSCPLLPENWYLQMGVEMGVLGIVLFVVLTILLTLRLSGAMQLAFVGVSIAALFLHAWEVTALAYSLWFLISLPLGQHQRDS